MNNLDNIHNNQAKFFKIRKQMLIKIKKIIINKTKNKIIIPKK
jgi:hypothetical protein